MGESVMFQDGEMCTRAFEQLRQSGSGGACRLFLEHQCALRHTQELCTVFGHVLHVSGRLWDYVEHHRNFVMGQPHANIAVVDRVVTDGGLVSWALRYGARAILYGDVVTRGKLWMIKDLRELRAVLGGGQ